MPCYSNNVNLQEMEEGTETFYSLKFKQCRMSAVNAEQASVKFYRKVWNAKIKEQVIQRVECGFLLVHFQWFSIFIMLKFSNEHDQMICRISNCTAHSEHRTSMFSLELWEEVVLTPFHPILSDIDNKGELGKHCNDEIASSRENECYKTWNKKRFSWWKWWCMCDTLWGRSDVRLISRWPGLISPDVVRVSVRAGTRAESPVSSPGTLSWPLACVGGINACLYHQIAGLKSNICFHFITRAVWMCWMYFTASLNGISLLIYWHYAWPVWPGNAPWQTDTPPRLLPSSEQTTAL